MSSRVTPRMKDLTTSPIKDKDVQKLFDQINSQYKILDKALSNIRNLKQISLVHEELTVTVVTYVNAGNSEIHLDNYDIEELIEISFLARSTTVGTGGMTVQLWDSTNGVEIGTIVFGAADDDVAKTIDVKSYFADKTGIIALAVNAKRTGVGANSTLCCANLDTR